MYDGFMVEIITRFYVGNADGEAPDLVTLYSVPVGAGAEEDQARLTVLAGPIYAEEATFAAHEMIFNMLPEVQRIEVTKRNGDGIRVYRKPS